jgi:hypothetical protein
VATFWVFANARLPSGEVISRMFGGQLWWLTLLLVPCLGWCALIYFVPPCAIATFAGTATACALLKLETPRSTQ